MANGGHYRTLADDHQMTQTVRANLDAAAQA